MIILPVLVLTDIMIMAKMIYNVKDVDINAVLVNFKLKSVYLVVM